MLYNETHHPLQISQIPWLDYFLDKNPIVRIGPKPTLTGVLYSYNVMAEYKKEMAAKDQQISGTEVEHYLDKYLKLKDSYPDLIDDNQIVNYLMLNILAGGDTTSATMRTVVYHLSKNPSAYSALAAELTIANLSLPAKWKDIQALPYLDAVIREALRIHPGISFIFERVVPETGFTLPDGRFIPGGTNVGINPAVTNRNREIFGEDADQFRPDRWLRRAGESEDEFCERSRKMKDVADFVFGGGSRVCMGRYLATLEIYKLFATLYSLFDVSNDYSFSVTFDLLILLCTIIIAHEQTVDCLYRLNLWIITTSGSFMMPGSSTSTIFQ